MPLLHITDRQVWEAAVAQFPEANFLQSWQWGSFQESMGKKVLRIAVGENGQTGLAQVVIETAKRGTYAALAGGPLLDWRNTDFVAAFFKCLLSEVRQQGVVFLRFRPQALAHDVPRELLERLGARLAPMHLTADLTLQLDLSLSEEQLLAQMRKNTRYEIRRAAKLGISTHISTTSSEVARFYQEQLAVAKRHHFVPFSQDFLQKQFEAFASTDQVALIHSYLGEQLLASAFVIFYNKEAVYHYGISTAENAKLPGAYATQWRAIQEAQRRGCTRYNFWGIAPESATKHRFAGVSLFKRGFGGVAVGYLPAQDIPLSAQYWLTWLFEMVRKKIRRL